jgi:peptide/nickel transport system ATP-binding protein
VPSENSTSVQADQHPSSKTPLPNNPLLEVKNLRVVYLTTRGPVKAVDGISFSIQPGEVVGLAGESGSGKSTIAHAILRILHPPALITGGKALFNGRDILEMDDMELGQFRWSKISIVFQSAMNALNPVMKIRNQLTDVMLQHGLTKSEAFERAASLFDLVGIEPQRLDAYPHQLSGGMRQRAVIAIALALNPPLLIMDEPTTALDVVVQKDILEQITTLREKLKFSILFITHDLSLLVEISDSIAIMYAGEIVERAPARELFEHPLHPYTLGLMNSFPSITGARHKLAGIPGSPPDLVSPPAGCRFHPRCTKVMPVCSEIAPQARSISSTHSVACHLFDQ